MRPDPPMINNQIFRPCNRCPIWRSSAAAAHSMDQQMTIGWITFCPLGCTGLNLLFGHSQLYRLLDGFTRENHNIQWISSNFFFTLYLCYDYLNKCICFLLKTKHLLFVFIQFEVCVIHCTYGLEGNSKWKYS